MSAVRGKQTLREQFPLVYRLIRARQGTREIPSETAVPHSCRPRRDEELNGTGNPTRFAHRFIILIIAVTDSPLGRLHPSVCRLLF